MIPIGTRIRFTQRLDCGPSEDHPAMLFADKGETGEITGHGTKEGYWVKTDRWDAPFGASDTEFTIIRAEKSKTGEGSNGK